MFPGGNGRKRFKEDKGDGKDGNGDSGSDRDNGGYIRTSTERRTIANPTTTSRAPQSARLSTPSVHAEADKSLGERRERAEYENA